MVRNREEAGESRLHLHAAALNLLVRLRREIADPPPPEVASPLPREAWTETDRKRYQRLRRQHDPLGEGQPWTWRTLLIKVAATVIVSARRILVQLSGSWPHFEYFRQVSDHVSQRPAVAHLWTG